MWNTACLDWEERLLAGRSLVPDLPLFREEAQRAVRVFKPTITVADPVTSLLTVNSQSDVRSMFTRIIDYLKLETVTALFTSLSTGANQIDDTGAGISSLMDTWITLNMREEKRARRRTLSVLKSRGMAHSNSVHEFTFSERGLQLLDPVPVAGG